MLANGRWYGIPVLVTGHTGFKGAWLCEQLLSAGARVSGYALPPATEPHAYGLLGLDARVDSTLADVRDLASFEAACARTRPQVVFHLAAQPIVRTAVEDPLATYATNVMGTAHVLDAVRRVPSVRAVVVVTSDKCYENVGWLWPYRENEPMGGEDPYSSSKGCAELVVSAYRRTYFPTGAPAVASARAGNVIGGGDWSRDRLVPDLVRALTNERDPVLRFPGAVRPWQHVLDAVDGYVTLAEHLLDHGRSFAEGWNFGPSEASGCTVVELAERFLAAWGSVRSVVVESQEAPHEAATLMLDSTLAHRRLGWAPRLDLGGAITWTAAWYRAWTRGEDPAAVTAAQIAGFAALH